VNLVFKNTGQHAFTVLVNLVVLCGLLLTMELAYRIWLYSRSNNIWFLTKLDASNRDIYGFLADDPVTGYSPANKTVVIPEWNGAQITIRDGVRVNPSFEPNSSSRAIVAVGDSFVFGEGVSDDESWPAILEQRLNQRVVNGGVSGYGPLQAVLRAEQLINKRTPSAVILSILVDQDLPRDRFITDRNFYRPAVIRQEDRVVRHTSVAESREIASATLVCAHPWIPEMFFWSYVAKRYFSHLGYDGRGRCIQDRHPKAATIDEILNYVVERFAALPSNKAILLQYGRSSFEGQTDQAQEIRDAASRHGIQIIDTYEGLKGKPFQEIYISGRGHHTKRGNEIVADLIAKELVF
jgi:hypothetical protein